MGQGHLWLQLFIPYGMVIGAIYIYIYVLYHITIVCFSKPWWCIHYASNAHINRVTRDGDTAVFGLSKCPKKASTGPPGPPCTHQEGGAFTTGWWWWWWWWWSSSSSSSSSSKDGTYQSLTKRNKHKICLNFLLSSQCHHIAISGFPIGPKLVRRHFIVRLPRCWAKCWARCWDSDVLLMITYHMYVCIYIYIFIYVYTYIHIHMHMHIHIHIDIDIHINIHI